MSNGDTANGEMEWGDVAEGLRAQQFLFLATVGPDGRPHVAMVAPVIEDDAIDGPVVWIATTRGSRKAVNALAHPDVAAHAAMDPARGNAQLFLRGTVEVVDDLGEKQRLWHSGLMPYDPTMFFGTPENPDMVLLKVRPTHASSLRMGAGRTTWARGGGPS